MTANNRYSTPDTKDLSQRRWAQLRGILHMLGNGLVWTVPDAKGERLHITKPNGLSLAKISELVNTGCQKHTTALLNGTESVDYSRIESSGIAYTPEQIAVALRCMGVHRDLKTGLYYWSTTIATQDTAATHEQANG